MTSPQPEPAALLTRDLNRSGVQRPNREQESLARLRHSVYASREEWEDADARQQYLAFLRGTSRLLVRPPLLSHASAGAVWDLPVLGGWPARLHETVPEGMSRSTRHLVRHRRAILPDAVERDGFLVTPPARTVIDLAAERGFAAGVMAADHVLKERLCTRDDMAHELEVLGTFPGCRAARDAVAFADERSLYPGESLSRARIAECGLEVPEIQVVLTKQGTFVAEVDFLWPSVPLVGEFDGKLKYGRQNPSGRPPEDVLWKEKLREDEIRSLGYGVVRWTWGVALVPRRLRRHLQEHGVPVARRPRART